jgi:hypothetical protein
MLSGDQCRERARHALETGGETADPKMVAEYDELARDWVALGRIADTQDRFQRDIRGSARR